VSMFVPMRGRRKFVRPEIRAIVGAEL
jgi:hypothetical protein